MEDLFRSYWWLLFPLGYFAYAAFEQYMRYRRHRDTLDLIKSYADQGRDPPPEVLARLRTRSLDGDEVDEDEIEEGGDRRAVRRRYRARYRRERTWYQVVLFGVMAAGFGYAAATDMYGAGEAFVIVTFVMAALCLASLVGVLTSRRD
ncbi:MAG TPA: hypothetical protein VEA44_14615 [Caulobacter sp.]|nr:hypothetical protein [Caulobacter sp.]